ncbi:TM2 domain-containing protein [Flavobacterium soli]|uniref:TM2 domain-containing protein n=1 Tax=Flavobacterium soli TaxID=344881 RepID=UPI000426C493|nr:TM2 domain-containing protein [Flavobacterium soli]
MEDNNKSGFESWNQPTNDPRPVVQQDNKKVLAGIMAILFGSFGVHKFILGYNNEGIILLVATAVGYLTLCFIIGWFVIVATSIIGLIEGIVYLTKSDAEFYETYQRNKKPWF